MIGMMGMIVGSVVWGEQQVAIGQRSRDSECETKVQVGTQWTEEWDGKRESESEIESGSRKGCGVIRDPPREDAVKGSVFACLLLWKTCRRNLLLRLHGRIRARALALLRRKIIIRSAVSIA